MPNRRVVALLVLGVFLVLGCARITGRTGTNVLVNRGITFELPIPVEEWRMEGKGIYYRTIHWTLRVDDAGNVTLNGANYGTVSRGDKLEVSWTGELFVNDQKREPVTEP